MIPLIQEKSELYQKFIQVNKGPHGPTYLNDIGGLPNDIKVGEAMRDFTGEEISTNYAMNFSMANSQKRQEIILSKWGFSCQCKRCLEEKSDGIITNEIYEKFDQLKNEAKLLQNDYYNNPKKKFRMNKILEEAICYKEMYDLAREKNASRSFIINTIIDNGFDAAVQGKGI